MGKSVFSVPIFFIVFRETLEAAIIISTLLGLVEQIVRPQTVDEHAHGLFVPHLRDPNNIHAHEHEQDGNSEKSASPGAGTGQDSDAVTRMPSLANEEDAEVAARQLMRKLRIQIALGSALGLFLALAIGAAFIAVWFTQAADLWSKTEELWEGIFSLIASLIILAMGLTMLKLDRARATWRVKLQRAFQKHREAREKGGRAGRFVLFGLPLITVLREGMEAVVFVGGVSLGQSATSIPIAAICGLLCGLICGFLIYAFASRATLRTFLIAMTSFLLLIGAGLFQGAVGDFIRNTFNVLLGADVDDSGGDGPGSFDVRGVVWHLDCCNPEDNTDGDGWSIFSALFGWTNTAYVGTILAYILYWLLAIAILTYMKWREGRVSLFGLRSAAYADHQQAKAKAQARARAAREQLGPGVAERDGSASAEGEKDGEKGSSAEAEAEAEATGVAELPR